MDQAAQSRLRPSARTLLLGAAGGAAATTAAALLAFGQGGGHATIGRAAAGRSLWPSQALQNTLALDRAPARKAPLFSLTDQHGRRVSLADLRGRVVVLEPMDPHCTDLCPIVSQEFVLAAHRLGAAARRVVFLGINVNQYHERPADVDAFSRHHGLDRLADWHFLTGSTQALRRVWKAYGIDVEPSRSGDVTHSALMTFVDPLGRERWIAAPDYARPRIPAFAAGIAAVAERLLR